MADVTVEFGAVDTGLEKTLKAVQNELNGLKAKVKGGELSMTELEQTMKRIGQVTSMEKNIKAIGDQSGATSAQVKTLGKAAEESGEKAKIGFGKIAVGATLAGAAAKVGSLAIEAAFAAAQKTVASFGDALNMGGRLNDLADRTGIAVDKILVLERAFHNSGVGADSFGSMINKMQKSIIDAEDGTSKAAYAFVDLGIKLSDLRKMSPDEQLRTIGKAVAGIQDPALRAATSMEIFSKSGGVLTQLFANFDGEVNTAKKQLGTLPEIMKGAAEQFDRISDNLVTVGGKFVEFAAGLIDKVKPALDAVTTALSMFDAAKAGQEIGDFFVGAGKAMAIFQDSVEEFKLGNFKQGFKLAFDAIQLQVMETANSIYTKLVAAFKTVGDFIFDQFDPKGPLAMVITSTFDFIAGYIKKVVSGTLFETFTNMGPAFSRIAEGLKQSAEAGSKSSELALQRIPVAAELAAEKAGKSLGEMPDNFKKNMAGVAPLFDTVTKKQDEIVDGNKEIAKTIEGIPPKLSAVEQTYENLRKAIEDYDNASDLESKNRASREIKRIKDSIAEYSKASQTKADKDASEEERAANAEKARQEKLKESAALKREEVALQIQINNAIAAGEVNQAEALKAEKELKKSIEELRVSGMGVPEATKLANEMARAAREAERVKSSLATKIGEQVKSKQEAEAVDPGGRLMKKAQEQISMGRYREAETTAQKIKANEQEAMIRGVGKDKDIRAIRDIARDYGLDQMKSEEELKKQLYKIRTEGDTSESKLKKGTEAAQKGLGKGMEKEQQKRGEEKKEAMTLEKMVSLIKDAVLKLETKLPQPIIA